MNKDNPPILSNSEKGFLILALIALAIWLLTKTGSEETLITQPEKEVAAIEPKIDNCFYFIISEGLDEFRRSYNASAKQSESPLQINSFIVHDNGKDLCPTFEYSFDDELLLTGSINIRDSSIRSIAFAWVFKDNPTSYSNARTSLNFLSSISAILTATNPTITASDKGEILRDLGLFDFKADNLAIGESWKGNTIRNGIRYSIGIAKGQIILFTAEHPAIN